MRVGVKFTGGYRRVDLDFSNRRLPPGVGLVGDVGFALITILIRI